MALIIFHNNKPTGTNVAHLIIMYILMLKIKNQHKLAPFIKTRFHCLFLVILAFDNGKNKLH